MQQYAQHVIDAIDALNDARSELDGSLDDLRKTTIGLRTQRDITESVERLNSAIDCIRELQDRAADALEEATSARERLERIAEATRCDTIDQEIGEAIERIEDDGYTIVGDLLEQDADYVGKRLEAVGYDVEVKPDDDLGGITGLWIVRAACAQEAE